MLLPHSHEALAAYVKAFGLGADDLLFPVANKTIERTVKAFAAALGRDPREYGCHSLRRTKAQALAENCSAQQLDLIRIALGHRWLSSTQSYLGTDRRKASAFTRSLVI